MNGCLFDISHFTILDMECVGPNLHGRSHPLTIDMSKPGFNLYIIYAR
jgi:hypothetical protein